MSYDAVIKLLVTERSSKFFQILKVHPQRNSLPTELNRPVVLRLDHLSEGADGNLLHIEFQSTNHEMRWRMLEYYSAIATSYKLSALPAQRANRLRREKGVTQFVLLMGHADRLSGSLVRDRVSLEFDVIELRELDPERILLRSSSVYDKVLGLLCVPQVYDGDWNTVWSAIADGSDNDPTEARDAFALLICVELLLGSNTQFKQKLQELGMLIDISDSPILKRMADDFRDEGARRILHDNLTDMGHETTEDDRNYLASLSTDDISIIMRQFRNGATWEDIRGYIPQIKT